MAKIAKIEMKLKKKEVGKSPGKTSGKKLEEEMVTSPESEKKKKKKKKKKKSEPKQKKSPKNPQKKSGKGRTEHETTSTPPSGLKRKAATRSGLPAAKKLRFEVDDLSDSSLPPLDVEDGGPSPPPREKATCDSLSPRTCFS